MAIKLTPTRPDDCYVRFHFAFRQKPDGSFEAYEKPEDEADENDGWIEFWSADAKACKDALKRINGRLYVLSERRDKRKQELSDEKAVEELEEFNRLITDGLAHRTKAWRLINSDGEAVEASLTMENARAVFGDEEHNLRDLAQEFLKDRKVFPLRASGNS